MVGVLHVDLHLPDSHSLKEKRSVLKSLKDRLRGRFNVAVAEVEPNELWQRSTVGIAAVAADRAYLDRQLREVVEWLKADRGFAVIRIDEERY